MLPLCKHQTVLVRKMEINLCNAGALKQLSLLQKCNTYKYLYKLNICVCIHIHAHMYLCSRFQFLYIPPLNKVRDPHAVKNPPITLQSAPHFHGLASMDLTNHRLYSAGLCIYVSENKSVYKWSHAVQTVLFRGQLQSKNSFSFFPPHLLCPGNGIWLTGV